MHNLHQQAAEILESFNFTRVRAYMELTNWRWGNGEVPSASELARGLWKLMQDTVEDYNLRPNEDHYSMSGGFVVMITAFQGNPQMTALFSIEHQDGTQEH